LDPQFPREGVQEIRFVRPTFIDRAKIFVGADNQPGFGSSFVLLLPLLDNYQRAILSASHSIPIEFQDPFDRRNFHREISVRRFDLDVVLPCARHCVTFRFHARPAIGIGISNVLVRTSRTDPVDITGT
jgi:hypothetical protein